MKLLKKCVFLMLVFSIGNAAAVYGSTDIGAVLNDTAKYIYETVGNPQVGSVGGEWAIMGLARSNYAVPDEYYRNYCENVQKYVKEKAGILHYKKYTEYSRVIVALTSVGENAADVGGYNLLMPLADYEKTVWQGINGPIWALIALDCGNYEIPQNHGAKIQATREMYINKILESQLPDGGWSLSKTQSDPDLTGMALQALSKYRSSESVNAAIWRALECMSQRQNQNGGFSSWDTENSESCVQVLVALCELGIPLDDARFVKNGNTILDSLMKYYTPGQGFCHTENGGTNLMATEQALYCLVALKRAQQGESTLYSMSDAKVINRQGTQSAYGLSGKNSDVRKMEIVQYGKTFNDIYGHENKYAIENLASRGIINGKTDISFMPEAEMTRAEFAAIVVKGLGLPQKSGNVFSDLKSTDWFYNYVNTASHYKIVNGVSQNEFNPYGTISREEAAVMIARAAQLCGMKTETDVSAVRDILAIFLDYPSSSAWAMESLAFCYDNAILSDEVMEIKPKEAVTRAEVAQMLYNMLQLVKLL